MGYSFDLRICERVKENYDELICFFNGVGLPVDGYGTLSRRRSSKSQREEDLLNRY